jgi:hypothetical protein
MTDDGGGVSRKLVVLGIAGFAVVGLVALVALAVGGLLVGAFVFDSGPEPPETRFEFERSGDDVVVTHAGGPSLDADNVWIVVDGRKPGTWSDFEDGSDRIEDGDRIRLRNVDEGAEIELRWSPPDGSRPLTLDTYVV